MDQETRENPIIEPEGNPEGEQKQPLDGLRRFLRTFILPAQFLHLF